jgi:heptosyltransferase II
LILFVGAPLHSFLIIQTAFIGDVILATALIEKLRSSYPDAAIDFLLRKGNESLLQGNPSLREVIVWNKKQNKLTNLFRLVKRVRTKKYDAIINVHRFASSGLITVFSGASLKIGFDKNPWSLFFTKRVRHQLDTRLHETQRNQKLIESITDSNASAPALYPSIHDFSKVRKIVTEPYITVAPASVWFTKQLPASQWIRFLDAMESSPFHIYLIGAQSDKLLCEQIKSGTRNSKVSDLSGELSFLESAALMKGAVMNYVNDSAPLHIASAMNAPVTAVFCSTVPAFGFGPLSEKSVIVETKEKLECRPCGLHGYRACPKGHFRCASTIGIEMLVSALEGRQ